jgi:hypothetical protein
MSDDGREDAARTQYRIPWSALHRNGWAVVTTRDGQYGAVNEAEFAAAIADELHAEGSAMQ